MKNQKKDLKTGVQKTGEKKSFEEPKLKYIEPKLIKHGDATNITFSIPFSPIPN